MRGVLESGVFGYCVGCTRLRTCFGILFAATYCEALKCRAQVDFAPKNSSRSSAEIISEKAEVVLGEKTVVE